MTLPTKPGLLPKLSLRLETRLRLYLVALHLAFGAVVVYALQGQPLKLLGAELLFLLSLWIGWRLLSALFVPLRLIETGTELIDEGDFTSTFVAVGQPEMDRLIEIYNRMIEALREERRHGREQEDFLSRVIDASPAGVVICDLGGALMRLNPAAARLLGEPASDARLTKLGAPWNQLTELEAGDSKILAASDGRRVRCRAGELRDYGFPRRFFVLEELTEELRLTEKAAYEKLIRMVSHEVNNSVGAVTSLLGSLGHYQLQLAGEDRGDFAGALEVGSGRLERLRAFVDAFAELVRLPDPERHGLELEPLVDELLTLYAPTLTGRNIRVERHRAEQPLPALYADRQQLEQALINVFENAAEAIGDDGVITVSTRLEGEVPELTIEDDGPGLDPRQSREIFKPFFTTKPSGQGLGLALVKEVFSRHGYPFTLENRGVDQERGCRFRVSFP